MKRKMLNRLMAASIAAIMTVSMTGCGGNADQPASSGDQTSGDTQANAGGQTGGETKTDEAEPAGSEAQTETTGEDEDLTPEVRLPQEAMKISFTC